MRGSWLVGTVCLGLGLAVGLLLGLALSTKDPALERGETTSHFNEVKPQPKHELQEEPRQPAPTKPVAAVETPKLETPKFDSELSGVVENEDGSPCPGFKLRALPELLDEVPGNEQDMWDGERIAAHKAELARRSFDSRSDGETAAEGAFKLEVCSGLTYRIRALEPGVVLMLNGNFNSYIRAPQTKLKLTLFRLKSVKVDVRFEDGTVPAAVNLNLTRNGLPFWYRWMGWKPDNVNFEMPVGDLVVKAFDTSNSNISGSAPLELKLSDKDPAVSIVLKRPQGLLLNVTVPTPYYSELRYVLMPEEQIGDGRYDPLSPSGGRIAAQIQGEKLFFPGTVKGNYCLFVVVRSTHTAQRVNLKLAGGSEEQSVSLTPLNRAEHILVRVYSPEGVLVDDASVMLSVVHESASSGDVVLFAPAGVGVYWLQRPEKALEESSRAIPPADAELSIRASHKKFGTVYSRIAFSGVEETELRFGKMATITVHVRNLPKSQLAEFVLSVLPEGANPNRDMSYAQYAVRPPTEPGNPPLAETMKFARVPAGPAKLILFRKYGYGSDGAVLISREITIVSPETEESIDVPDLFDLFLSAEPKLDKKIQPLFQTESMIGTFTRLEDGTYVARQMPAGEYVVSASQLGGMLVTVPASGPVAFDMRPMNSQRVRAYDLGGAYFNSGLRVGDVILSINGEFSEGSQGLRDLRDKSAKAATATLEVKRGTQRLQITLSGDRWQKPWAAGEGLSAMLVK